MTPIQRRRGVPSQNERADSRSIHIGLNRVDGTVFQDILEDLTGAENDAEAMCRLANDSGCSTRVFLSEDATRDNVLDALETTIERLAPGDFLMITYAGHGTALRGAASDPDGWDEAWCLYDGVLLDDELHDLLVEAPEDCDIVVVTDACFAGGIVDDQSIGLTAGSQLPIVGEAGGLTEPTFELTGAPDGVFAPRQPRTRTGDDQIAALLRAGKIEPGRRPRSGPPPRVSARVVSLAAAAEGELAFEGPTHGLFTAALVTVVEEFGTEQLTYEELMNTVAEAMAAQNPTFGTLGTRPSESRVRRVFDGSAVATTGKADQKSGTKAGKQPVAGK